ncbi:MAG: hypothetical protein ACLRWM_04605 [Streptococcus sp.]
MKAATDFRNRSKPAVIKVRKIEPVSEEEEMKEIVETVKLDSSKRKPRSGRKENGSYKTGKERNQRASCF